MPERDDRLALDLARGVSRLMLDLGHSPLTELTLNTGRRVDVAGLGKNGHIIFVEIKSSLADFRADVKWPEYLDYCDQFFFAVAEDFPVEVLPETTGLILADRYGGEIVRPAPEGRAQSARKRAVLLRFARAAASRLFDYTDAEL